MRILLSLLAAFLWFHGAGFTQTNQDGAKTDAARHISQGITFIRGGQSEKALEEFKVANGLAPNSSQALVWLGIALSQLGRVQESVDPFSRALKLDPKLLEAHYNLGLSFARLGRRKDAIRELKAVVRSSPALADAQYNLAILLEEESNTAEAISHLEVVRRERPNDFEVGVHLTSDLWVTNRSSEALELSKKLFQQNPNDAVATQLGKLLVENGYFAEAVPMLELARSAAPDSLLIEGLLGRAYVGAGSASQAIELLKPHQESDRSGSTAYLLGLAYLSQKEPSSALQAFRVAAELRPADPSVHFHMGGLFLESTSATDQDSGISELNKAIELAPQESLYYKALGRWLLEHNRVNEAASVLHSGEERSRPSAELYALLSVVEALHQSPQAQVAAEKAIALDPKIALAHEVLGFFYFRSGDYLAAAESYKTASDLSSGTGHFAYDAALALERANKPAEAVPYAERAVTDDPEVAINHYLLGKLYSKLEKRSESIRELESAVRLNPSLDYPYYLLARMYMRTGETAKAQELNGKLQELKKEQMKLHGIDTMISEPEAAPSLRLEKSHLDSESAQH